MTILDNKRSFLGSDNKLKYVLSSFGKEKIRIIPIESFFYIPTLPCPNRQNRGIEEVGGR